jgi:cytochrome c-type biogenesis protein CcmH/NrfG
MNQERYSEAVQAYEEAIRLDPNSTVPGTTKAMLSRAWTGMMKPSGLMIRL